LSPELVQVAWPVEVLDGSDAARIEIGAQIAPISQHAQRGFELIASDRHLQCVEHVLGSEVDLEAAFGADERTHDSAVQRLLWRVDMLEGSGFVLLVHVLRPSYQNGCSQIQRIGPAG
jgi:hypothetical protein